jgi:hypothetical protein
MILSWIVLAASLGIALLHIAENTAVARRAARWFFSLLLVYVLLVVVATNRGETSSQFADLLLAVGYAGFGTFAGVLLVSGGLTAEAALRRNQKLTTARLEFLGAVAAVIALAFVIRHVVA